MARKQLVLACGNTLRGDDGVGWKIAEGLEKDVSLMTVQIATVHQLTPEWAETLSDVDTVVFLDCSVNTLPGEVSSFKISGAPGSAQSLTHYIDPASLLALTLQLYGGTPRRSFAVTVGGASFEVSEKLTEAVRLAVPRAVAEVRRILLNSDINPSS